MDSPPGSLLAPRPCNIHVPLGAAPRWVSWQRNPSERNSKPVGEILLRALRLQNSPAVEQPSGSQPLGILGEAGEEQRAPAPCPQGPSVTKHWPSTAHCWERILKRGCKDVTQVPPFAAIQWQSREGLRCQELSRTLCLPLLYHSLP